jgi:hypothetical protein
MGTWICLRADLVDEFDDAEEELAASQVEDAQTPRLASGVSARTKKLAEKRVRELEEQIEAAQVRFQFRSMSEDPVLRDWCRCTRRVKATCSTIKSDTTGRDA